MNKLQLRWKDRVRDRRRITLLASFALMLTLTAACHRPASLSSRWGIPPFEQSGDALSFPVLLVADNQLHYLYGDPVWLRSGFTNQFVSVAIRPVQLDLYGPDILHWTIREYGNKLPVVHLGDALNIACSAEFDAFVKIMGESGRGWVMAPGNHDANYFGNGHFSWNDWQRACTTEDGTGYPMTKDRFVRAYLQALQEQKARGAGFGLSEEALVNDAGRWEALPGQQSLLSAAAWRIDTKHPWRSYVVQRLNLTLPATTQSDRPRVPVTAILLDTAQYHFRPRLLGIFLFRNAGTSGEVGQDQIDIVDEWLSRAEPSQVTVIMGHHPYHTLSGRAQKAIDRWRRERGVALYVSGHTHTAQYFVRSGAEGNWLELNLGSTTDWPPEFRTLTVSRAVGYDAQVAFRLERVRLEGKVPACEPEWEVTTNREDFYITYEELITPDPTKTQIALMDTLLRSYEWLLRFVKSSPDNAVWPSGTHDDASVLAAIHAALSPTMSLDRKRGLARQLQTFEAERAVEDQALQHDFHYCQAMLASKYDLRGARAPNVDDSFLLVPKE